MTSHIMTLFKQNKQKVCSTTQQVVDMLNATYPTGTLLMFTNAAARAKHWCVIRGFVVSNDNPYYVEPHFIVYSSACNEPDKTPIKFIKECSRFAINNTVSQTCFRALTVDEACQFYDALAKCNLFWNPYTTRLETLIR